MKTINANIIPPLYPAHLEHNTLNLIILSLQISPPKNDNNESIKIIDVIKEKINKKSHFVMKYKAKMIALDKAEVKIIFINSSDGIFNNDM